MPFAIFVVEDHPVMREVYADVIASEPDLVLHGAVTSVEEALDDLVATDAAGCDLILTDYRLDTATIVTALLHDVVEDTSATRDDIAERFGEEVASLVEGVTKLSRLELQAEHTRQAENLRKFILAISKDVRVLLVKLDKS